MIFNSEKFTILVPIHDAEQVVGPVRHIIQDGSFYPKDEYHVTLLGFARGRELKSLLIEKGADLNAIASQIENLLGEIPPRIEFANDYYCLYKEFKYSKLPSEHRESIVVMATIPNLDEFWSRLESIVGTTIPKPFPHMTIATRGSDPARFRDGIGIKDASDFEMITKQKIAV